LGGYGLLARAALAGELTVSELVTCLMALGGLRAGLDTASSVHEHAAEPVAALAELERLPAAEKRVSTTVTAGEIRFEGVSFGYPGADRRVLDGFDLTIPAGRSLALVGLNGAGKSTITKLLCGLHRPDAGRVTVGGQDLAELDQAAWRAQLAVLFQDFSRYELSVEENLSIASPEPVSTVELEDALADVGLTTALGTVLATHHGGTDLSGGQWQRLALARTLVRMRQGAGVVVLDEPTASLDVRAESELFRHILDLTAGRTTVLISHRFSTVRHADRIAVVGDGRVLELGAHEELLAAEGIYARLFHAQADRFLAPAGTADD
jgi:ATP-binding cassette subfamily B protein